MIPLSRTRISNENRPTVTVQGVIISNMGSKSWLDVPSGSHFSLANIPFGIISTLKSPDRHAAVAIGDHVLDLYEFAQSGGFSKLDSFAPGDVALFSQSSLNNFAARGQKYHRDIRRYLQNVLSSNTDYPEILKTNPDAQETAIFPRADVNVHLPMKIGGYTDFFVGKNHAYNCGCIFRDPKNALQPNYLHLPVAYNSRASSVVPSGTPVRRPLGQFLATPESKTPSFGPCQRLDIELELGALLCKGNPMGEPIDVNEAETYIFGFVILNDWSARDIQKWEAVPLGPFNAKTFASTISPWVILKDALEPYHTAGIHNETALHPYLQEDRKENVYDIELEVQLKRECCTGAVLATYPGIDI